MNNLVLTHCFDQQKYIEVRKRDVELNFKQLTIVH